MICSKLHARSRHTPVSCSALKKAAGRLRPAGKIVVYGTIQIRPPAKPAGPNCPVLWSGHLIHRKHISSLLQLIFTLEAKYWLGGPKSQAPSFESLSKHAALPSSRNVSDKYLFRPNSMHIRCRGSGGRFLGRYQFQLNHSPISSIPGKGLRQARLVKPK